LGRTDVALIERVACEQRESGDCEGVKEIASYSLLINVRLAPLREREAHARNVIMYLGPPGPRVLIEGVEFPLCVRHAISSVKTDVPLP
jgi:hypothetical protein